MASEQSHTNTGSKEKFAVRKIGRLRVLSAGGSGSIFLPTAILEATTPKGKGGTATMTKGDEAGNRLVHGSGLYEKHLTGLSKRSSLPDYNYFAPSVQCKFCGSDYMRFAVDGHCQRCQQRVEYILREARGPASSRTEAGLVAEREVFVNG